MNANIRQHRLLRALAGHRGGASAAEFALVIPLLVTFLFGSIQYGVMMFTYNLMQDAARDTARGMAVCSIQPGAEVAHAQAGLPAFLPAGNFQITPVSPGNGVPGDVSVSITVPGNQASILSLLPAPGTLRATSTMLKESNLLGGGLC